MAKVKCPNCGETKTGKYAGLECPTCRMIVQKYREAQSDKWCEDEEPTGRCLRCEALQRLFDRGDGWVRFTGGAGKVVQGKFRFNSGAHAGKYVYWVNHAYANDLDIAENLLNQTRAVDAGILKPSPDIYH